MAKTVHTSGADQFTPSIPEYFDWINHTWEGPTEDLVLSNLDYFRYMKEQYGMEIKLYLLDAGVYDYVDHEYGDYDSEKFRKKFPNGFGPIVEKAKDIGIRMGIWVSPDGFGNDSETEKKRYDFFVRMCREFNMGIFKLDACCGTLRPEKTALYSKMLGDCRKFCPDLVVLNHRINLFDAEKYVTTYLWNGLETYTDVLIKTENTAMHNRAYTFTRGHTEGLDRLAEDHGVCLSSSLDFFDDDMIYQAFSRCLILAPEIYGNPWLLKDSEQPKLARIYNLHKHNAAILVNGMRLGEKYGDNAVSRGSDRKRFICTGNNTWNTRRVSVTIDESVGIKEKGEYRVILRHPHEELLYTLGYGDSFEIDLLPFRATLLEISAVELSDPVLSGFPYKVIREDENGNPTEFVALAGTEPEADRTEKAPVYLGTLNTVTGRPSNDEFLFETAMFGIDNDSMEKRCLKRAGRSGSPEIEKCREMFFGSPAYIQRGPESGYMFDGNEETFFDGESRSWRNSTFRVNGGCLRVDLRESYDIERIEIIAFSAFEETNEIVKQNVPAFAEVSNDLITWRRSKIVETKSVCGYSIPVQKNYWGNIVYNAEGEKVSFTYRTEGTFRYVRIPEPMDRIFSFRVFGKDGEIKPVMPFANNLQSPYSRSQTVFAKKAVLSVPAHDCGDYLAVAVNGRHGEEGVYAVIEYDGKVIPANRRCVAFRTNSWECPTRNCEQNTTYFFDLPEAYAEKQITVTALFNKEDGRNTICDVYLCDRYD